MSGFPASLTRRKAASNPSNGKARIIDPLLWYLEGFGALTSPELDSNKISAKRFWDQLNEER